MKFLMGLVRNPCLQLHLVGILLAFAERCSSFTFLPLSYYHQKDKFFLISNHHNHLFHENKLPSNRPLSSLPDDVIMDTLESKNMNVQLWLDLRRTTIPPQTALLHLTDDLWDEYTPPSNKSFLVDKVLINQSNGIEKIADDLMEEFETEVGLLSYCEEKNEILEMNDEGVMLPFGKVVNVEDETGKGVINVNVDPMPVLEAVSNGEWVILDVNGDVDTSSILTLIELVSNACQSPLFSSPSSSSSSTGGIGIRCESQSSVMEMGALIKSLCGSKGYETNESGILVQSSDENQNQISDDTKSGDAPIGFAIVMPFDSVLWQTSSFIYGEVETQ